LWFDLLVFFVFLRMAGASWGCEVGPFALSALRPWVGVWGYAGHQLPGLAAYSHRHPQWLGCGARRAELVWHVGRFGESAFALGYASSIAVGLTMLINLTLTPSLILALPSFFVKALFP
jgi:hypothetical protein